ncbi:nitroreductase family protein [Streptomyces thermolineatus]|uniref:Nitroreductase family protein n=1 Tax=Streptomyces thermolineatus TaxID=44033 RepID=A0ABP5ZF45_9ACTN
MTVPALTREQLETLVEAGLAAPSVHNMQPWRFRTAAGSRVLRVYADPERTLPVADPRGRTLHMSVGAALFNVRVAAAHLGLDTEVRLLPDPDDPMLAAEVEVTGPAPTRTPYGRDLFPAIRERRSSRLPYTNRDVPETALGELMEAAAAEGAVLLPLEEDGMRRVMDLTDEAERRNSSDPARREEVRHWLRREGDDARDGLPAAALGPVDAEAHVPMRNFTGTPVAPAVPPARFEPLPGLATLSTVGDTPADWLRAGQALERVLLVATLHGLRASLLHQAMEWQDLRWALRDPEGGPAHVQMVLRVGYGPPGPATPRRPVPEVLEVEDRAAR